MEQRFTQKDIVRFIYRETSIKERMQMHEAIRSDWNLKERFSEIFDAYKALPKISLSPSQKSINTILQHSSNSSLQLHY